MKTRYLALIAGIFMVLGLLTSYHGSVGWTWIIIMASLVAFLVKFGLALWILLLNHNSRVNRFFAAVFIGQAVWDLGKFVMWLTPYEPTAMIWAKISYTGYILSVFFMLNFVWAFLKKKNFFTTKYGRIVFYAPMVFMLGALWVGNQVIVDLIPPNVMSYGYGIELWSYSYGAVYNYFFVWFQALPFLYAFMHFVFRYFYGQRNDKKKQMLYLLVGSAFPIMIGIPTGVLLPFFDIYLPPHNNLLSLVMSVFIAIGIIKYKFLTIQPIGEHIVPGRKLEHKLAQKYLLQTGKSYFITHERSSDIAHKVMLTHLYRNRYGLIITARNPTSVRQDYGIETTPIVWLTDTDTQQLSVDPIDIQQLYETIHMFVRKVPNAIVLIDGLDYLIQHNNFEKILHFITQIRLVVVQNGACLIITKGSAVLTHKQERMINQHLVALPFEARREDDSDKDKVKYSGHINYVLIGHNPLSQSIVSEFEKRHIVPTLIEKQDILAHYLKGSIKHIQGDPLTSKVLENAGVGKPSTVVIITLEDDSDVILCINKIRQISDSVKIITSLHDYNFMSIAVKAGADSVVPSAAIGGRLISLSLSSPAIVKWVMDSTTYSAPELELIELVASSGVLVGKTIGAIDKKLGKAGNIIGIKTARGLIPIPDDAYTLEKGDRLVVEVSMKIIPEDRNIANLIGCVLCEKRGKVSGRRKGLKGLKKKAVRIKRVNSKSKKK
ncbi:DUF835 domain-containing protein [Candidatus Woesearchaeota archaeon]|nr:DUF835 domain-containing protein [Candidatus Woesearchaeota archaeon]